MKRHWTGTERVFEPGKIGPEKRRKIMASILRRDTAPELKLRSALWLAGVRGWRCHYKLLGSPDVAFPRWKVAVFVDGVWWHGHPDYLPHGRRGPYWDKKIARNMERDARVAAELAAEGWRVVRIWDLDVLRRPEAAAARVLRALETRGWTRRANAAPRRSTAR